MTTTALRWLPAWTCCWCCRVCLLESIRAGDHDLESTSVLSIIGSCCLINAGTPEGALVVCDGSRQSAVSGRVERWVALNEDIETSAKGGVVTVLSTRLNVVSHQGEETEICVSVDEGVKVLESGDVSSWCNCILGLIVERLIGFECLNGIGHNVGSIAYDVLVEPGV